MPRKLPAHIRRVDHHYFHGFLVQVTRRLQRYERYFRDQDGRAATLQRAIRFRDRLLLTLPPPRMFKMTSRTNKTGVIGVVLSHERTRAGRPVRFYKALWYDAHGRRRSRTFSVQKYGKQQAFALARETRARAVDELLRPAQPRATPLLTPRRRAS